MTKHEFITQLRDRLSELPEREVEERLSFYVEMIDDRIEDGRTEQEAVADLGPLDEVVAQIVADIPLLQIAKKRIKPTRRLKAWEIVLLAVGSPVWASLLIAALAVLIALYASFWAIIVSLWAAFGSLAGCALGGVVSGFALSMGANLPAGMALIGAGIVCAGLSVLLFFACKAATKGLVVLASKTVLAVKRCLIKKEGVA
ncbi:MAG: DUF1700 domain-containing protein [Ruminococcaceae bacterium]|nr:DUF1700 domain-containing protein [Oscillospiraceae bacterium]